MQDYEAALKQAGCDLTPLDYIKKYNPPPTLHYSD